MDDEIIAPSVYVQTMARRPVTLLTYDTGMVMRAHAAGLTVRKLTQDDEPRPGDDEPEEVASS
jgi:hypothetical protein